MLPQDIKIRVFPHAAKRFQQRFKLYFPYGYSRPYTTIAKLIRDGRVCTAWETVPFYKNKINSKHGQLTVVHSMPCYFICSMVNERLVVKTVLDKWVCEPKSK